MSALRRLDPTLSRGAEARAASSHPYRAGVGLLRRQQSSSSSRRPSGRSGLALQQVRALFAGFAGSTSGSAAAPLNTVKVYEAGKQSSGKRIVAETVVQAPVDVVWRVLTNYDRLAEFVPNLESCERLPSPGPGRVRIRQRGCSQGVLWRLEAQAVMEVDEVRLPMGRREARFTMLDGDFQDMSGRWVVEPDPSSAVGMATLLRFDINVQPKITLPSAIVSYVVRAGLPANIQAVARRAEEIATNKLRVSGLARWAGTEDDPPIPMNPAQAARKAKPAWEQEAAEEQAAFAAADAVDSGTSRRQQLPQQRQADSREDGLPGKGPFWRNNGSSFPEAAPLTAARQRQQQGAVPMQQDDDEEEGQEMLDRPLQPRQQQSQQQQQPEATIPQSLYLGVVSVPLPPAGNRDSSTTQARTQQELNLQLEQKEQLQAAYPAFGLRRASSRSGGSGSGSLATLPAPSSIGSGRLPTTAATAAAAGSAEVHLRRLDTFDLLHRRAVAAIMVDAPPEAVWAVLTDYNRLAEFIPNLAVSQRIALPASAPPNIIRLRQVGYKRMMYMCLHAESVLDLIEKPESEIQFRQVAGDFEKFQGKWMLQGVGGSRRGSDDESSGCSYSQTQLKYAVEIVIPRATRMLGVLEPLLERTVFEDVPANLAAIKQRVESMQAERDICLLEEAGETAAAAALRRKLERPSLADMIEDYPVLVAELERCFGSSRVLPSRSDLREINRSDLEKAISAHGGPTVVAQQLGWKLKAKTRRPKGYWDSPDNVRAELDEFIEEQGMTSGMMPAKNDFVRAGRYDIARAVERWGGLYELAEELGYAVTDSRKQGSTEWQSHISAVAASTGLSGRAGLFELAAKTYAAKRSMQGSVDGSDEFVLADVLALDAISSNGSSVATVTSNGRSGSSAAGKGAGSGAAGSSASNGASKGAGSKAQSKPAAAQRRRLDRLPTMRDEIDAW